MNLHFRVFARGFFLSNHFFVRFSCVGGDQNVIFWLPVESSFEFLFCGQSEAELGGRVKDDGGE